MIFNEKQYILNIMTDGTIINAYSINAHPINANTNFVLLDNLEIPIYLDGDLGIAFNYIPGHTINQFAINSYPINGPGSRIILGDEIDGAALLIRIEIDNVIVTQSQNILIDNAEIIIEIDNVSITQNIIVGINDATIQPEITGDIITVQKHIVQNIDMVVIVISISKVYVEIRQGGYFFITLDDGAGDIQRVSFEGIEDVDLG